MFHNTVGELSALPVAIQGYYQEEVRSEPLLDENGEQVTVTETYEYEAYDNDGNLITQEGLRVVPQYHDVTYIVEKPRYDLKSWDDVERAGNHNHKLYCIQKACESEQWEFHDSYIEWLESEPEYTSWEDEEGVQVDNQEAIDAWQASEPVNTSTEPGPKIAELNAAEAINTRFNAVYEPLDTVHGFIDVGRGKDGILGMDNIKDAVAAHGSGLTEVESVAWIMSDNSVATLTIEDLNQIIVDFNMRKQDIFTAYGQWRAGDKQEAFTL